MSQTISAIYKNGTLVLEEPLGVSDGARVEVNVFEKHQDSGRTPGELLAEIAALPKEEKEESFSNRDHDKVLYDEGQLR